MILLSYYDTGCCLHASREFKTVSLLNSGNVEQNQGLADKAVVVLFLRRELGCHQRKQASSHRLQPQPETCNLWSSHVTWSTETTWDHLGPPGPTILQVIPIYGRIPVSFHMTMIAQCKNQSFHSNLLGRVPWCHRPRCILILKHGSWAVHESIHVRTKLLQAGALCVRVWFKFKNMCARSPENLGCCDSQDHLSFEHRPSLLHTVSNEAMPNCQTWTPS